MFMMQTPPPLSHDWVTMDRLFLRSFNVVSLFNIRLL